MRRHTRHCVGTVTSCMTDEAPPAAYSRGTCAELAEDVGVQVSAKIKFCCKSLRNKILSISHARQRVRHWDLFLSFQLATCGMHTGSTTAGRTLRATDASPYIGDAAGGCLVTRFPERQGRQQPAAQSLPAWQMRSRRQRLASIRK